MIKDDKKPDGWRLKLKAFIPDISDVLFVRRTMKVLVPRWQFCGFEFGSKVSTRDIVDIKVYIKDTVVYNNTLEEGWLNNLNFCFAVAKAIRFNIQKIKEKTMSDTNAQMIDPKEKPQNFSWALQWLKDGHKVARLGWNGKNQWVTMQEGSEVNGKLMRNKNASSFYGDKTVKIRPHLDIKTADDSYVCGWTPSTGDLLADDWVIVK